MKVYFVLLKNIYTYLDMPKNMHYNDYSTTYHSIDSWMGFEPSMNIRYLKIFLLTSIFYHAPLWVQTPIRNSQNDLKIISVV